MSPIENHRYFHIGSHCRRRLRAQLTLNARTTLLWLLDVVSAHGDKGTSLKRCLLFQHSSISKVFLKRLPYKNFFFFKIFKWRRNTLKTHRLNHCEVHSSAALSTPSLPSPPSSPELCPLPEATPPANISFAWSKNPVRGYVWEENASLGVGECVCIGVGVCM